MLSKRFIGTSAIIFFILLALLTLTNLLIFKLSQSVEKINANQIVINERLDSITEQIEGLKSNQIEIENNQSKIDEAFGLTLKIDDITNLGVESSAEIVKQCNEKGIPVPIMLAIYDVESRFNPSAINSTSNASGLGQILPSTAQAVARNNNISYSRGMLTDPRYNIRLTTSYLSDHLYSSLKDWGLAVRYYGEGTDRYTNKVMSKASYYNGILNSTD